MASYLLHSMKCKMCHRSTVAKAVNTRPPNTTKNAVSPFIIFLPVYCYSAQIPILDIKLRLKRLSMCLPYSSVFKQCIHRRNTFFVNNIIYQPWFCLLNLLLFRRCYKVSWRNCLHPRQLMRHLRRLPTRLPTQLELPQEKE